MKQNLKLSMARISVPILATAISAGLLCPADAAVKIPNQYDGSWTIIAATAQGPCSASTSYQVQIRDSDASIPGDEIDIAGGVSARGAVKATITKGANRVPIAGSLSTKGSGSGTWSTSGGLIECSGSWSAKRTG